MPAEVPVPYHLDMRDPLAFVLEGFSDKERVGAAEPAQVRRAPVGRTELVELGNGSVKGVMFNLDGVGGSEAANRTAVIPHVP